MIGLIGFSNHVLMHINEYFLDLRLSCMIRDFEFIKLEILGRYYCYFMVGDIQLCLGLSLQ